MKSAQSVRTYTLLIALTDALSALVAFYFVTQLYWSQGRAFEWSAVSPFTALMGVVAFLIGIWSMRGYQARRIFRIADEVAILLLGSLVGMGIFAGSLFFLDREEGRLLVLFFALLAPLLSLAFRVSWRQFFKWRGAPRLPTARVLIVGADQIGHEVGEQFRSRAWLGLELVGYVDDLQRGRGILGTMDELETICLQMEIDVVVVTLPVEEHGKLAGLLDHIHDLPIQVKLLPDVYPLAYLDSRLEMFGGVPVLGLAEPVLAPWQAAVKRAMDVSVAVLGLLFALPLMVLIAVGIRLTSPGPIIFTQHRVGEGGRLFRMYKFRTMVEGAERILLDELDAECIHIKQARDPRVTPLGRWLRRLSLDELPQLVNVLQGEMSIVGPRPELPYLVERYEPWQRRRLLVPQGITGWWQINGRSDKPMFFHTEDDLYYVRNYSLLLDIEIMWKTIWVVLRGRGAY